MLSVSKCSGLMSRELCPYVKSVVGVDISQGMVDQFNLRAFNQGLPPEEMKAVCLDLKREDHEFCGAKFNVIVVSSRNPGSMRYVTHDRLTSAR